MGRAILSLSILSFGFVLLLLFYGCGSSLPNVELNKGYNFAAKQSITTYVVPTGDTDHDETYSRVLFLDLRARGYNVIDANRLLKEYSAKIIAQNHRQIADSLQSKKYLPITDVYVLVSTAWDSAYVMTYYSEETFIYWKEYSFAGLYVPTLTSNVSFFDHSIREPIKYYTASDTTSILSENENAQLLYPEYPWMVVAKQLSREFTDIPICSIVNSSPPSTKFQIDLWVDNSYREAFPDTWKDRLRRRVLYANDILRPQFDIELSISKIIEWNSSFDRNLENTLEKLYSSTASNPNALQIGITFNKDLKRNWTSKNDLGFAYLLSNDAVITAQPSFPSIGQDWNSIEEAITLVHEVGHMLGAIHVPDENSIMYPSAGSLTFEFDSVNRKLIEAIKVNFLNQNQKERIITYSDELVKIKDFPSSNSNPILPAITNVVEQINQLSQIINKSSEKTFSNLYKLLPDSATTLAVMGYLDFQDNEYERAHNTFMKVLEINPDFAEVQYYLSLICRKNGDSKQADFYKNLAKPYSKLWIIEKRGL